MKSLLPEDHAHISQMIGDVFVVEEIDDGGQAWVTKWSNPPAIAIAAAQRVWDSHRLLLKLPRVTVRVNVGQLGDL
jgi:hypothetical protein